MCKFGHTAAVFFYFVMLFSGIIRHNFVSSLSIFSSSPFTTPKSASGAGFGVFSVFCCLTFAWFTSQDEVTNRLTASSDYGVSIVESFVPPKNWIPGQEINKDVYAVNTGNIDAFVKETVSAKLTYTYEETVPDFGSANLKYVELSPDKITAIDGATTEEAGGFLVWTNAKDGAGNPVEIGSVNSARKEDAEATPSDVKPTRWTPTYSGDYLFRRSIGTVHHDAEGTVGEADYKEAYDETVYTYAAYHYEAPKGEETTGKYYKVVVGSDKEATKDGKNYVFDISIDQTALGVTVDKDGIPESDPTVMYVIESKVENVSPNLKLVRKTGDETRDYLSVVYTADTDSKAKLDALQGNVDKAKQAVADAQTALDTAKEDEAAKSTTAAQKEVALRNAEGAYNSAKSRYDQTKADYDYAKALKDATDKLATQAETTAKAESAYKVALDDLNKAAKDIKDDAGTTTTANTELKKLADLKALFDTSGVLNKETLVPTSSVRTTIGNGGPAGHTGESDFTNVEANLALFDDYWQDIMDGIDAIGAQYDILAAINNEATDVASATNASDIRAAYDKIEELTIQLQKDYTNYKKAYADFVDSLTKEDTLSGLKQDLTAPDTSAADGLVSGGVTHVKGADSDLGKLVAKYEEEYADLISAETKKNNEDYNWKQAINTYNQTASKAKEDYETAIADAVGEKPNAYTPVDYGETIVNGGEGIAVGTGYSAIRADVDRKTPADRKDPQIADSVLPSNYVTIATTTPYTVSGKYSKDIASEADFTQIKANYADNETDADDTPSTDPQKLSALETAMNDAKKVIDGDGTDANKGAKKEFTEAQTAYNNAKDDVYAKNTALTKAEQNLTAAEGVYDGYAESSAEVKIKVYLDENWETNWNEDDRTDNTTDVDFYLNKILVAGETSERLIDGVEMDEDMGPDDYKELTFDLNVGLESVQVAYDENQRGYTTETVEAADNFKMDAALTNPMTKGTAVTWSGDTVTTTTYKVDDTAVTPVANTTYAGYAYEIELAGKKYYGAANTDGTKFYPLNATGTAVDTTESGAKTLTVTTA